MPSLDTRTFVYRILRRMSRFRTFDEVSPAEYAHIGTAPRERALGVYENSPGSSDESVLVTTNALVVTTERGIIRVPFAAVREVTWHPESKRDAVSVQVTLDDGSVVNVPVTGRENGGADVFEFVRFVSRASGIARA